jgi:hypothetical protein
MHIEVVLTMFKSRFSLQFSFVWKSNLELRYLSTEAITNKMGGGGGGGGEYVHWIIGNFYGH